MSVIGIYFLLTFCLSDFSGGFEAHHPTGHLATHLQTHEDMHERRPGKKAQVRHDCTHSGEDAGEVKSPLCSYLLNCSITGFRGPDLTLMLVWCLPVLP